MSIQDAQEYNRKRGQMTPILFVELETNGAAHPVDMQRVVVTSESKIIIDRPEVVKPGLRLGIWPKED